MPEEIPPKSRIKTGKPRFMNHTKTHVCKQSGPKVGHVIWSPWSMGNMWLKNLLGIITSRSIQ
ncbi:hypothetical protein PIB30_103546, partial [Stylosanthes scabra]|nr:hypothetical protein [Stylosanthes scabra]